MRLQMGISVVITISWVIQSGSGRIIMTSPRDVSGTRVDVLENHPLKWQYVNSYFQVNVRLIYLAVCQNLVPLVNIKIAGKWMAIPLKMVLIGIDPYPFDYILYTFRKSGMPS